MAHELAFTPEADEALSRLEDDLSAGAVVDAVRATLGRLEIDPFDPRLGTRVFQSAELEHVRATPVRMGDWWVLWVLHPDDRLLVIVHVGEIPHL